MLEQLRARGAEHHAAGARSGANGGLRARVSQQQIENTADPQTPRF